MKKLLLWTALTFTGISLPAQQFEYGGLNYEVNDASAWTVTVTGATDETALTDLALPATVKYNRATADNRTETVLCTISAIGRNSFNGCKNLLSVTMPNTVTSIAMSAFQGCTLLECVELSDNIEYIGNSAFSGCASLMDVDMPSKLKTIDYSAFSQCTILNRVSLNSGLETIGQYAFSNNDALREITIPASVKTIGQLAFYRCNVLRKVTFEGAVEKVESRAFDYSYEIREVHAPGVEEWCKTIFADETANPLLTAKKLYFGGEAVTNLVIPATIKNVPEYSFRGLETLVSLTLEDGVERIERRAFAGCPNLVDVDFGNTVNTLGVRSFEYCTALKSMTLPNSIAVLGNYCFGNCTGLERVNWNRGVESVLEGAFNSCSALTTIDVPDLSQWCTIKFSSNSNPLLQANIMLINGEELEELVIPADVVDIPDYAFDGGADFKSLVVPDNVKTIGTRAFWAFDKLEKASIGSGVNMLNLYSLGTSYGLKVLNLADGETPMTLIGYTDWGSGWAIPTAITDVYVGRPLTVSGTFAPELHYLTFGPDLKTADMIDYTKFGSLKLITCLGTEPPAVDEFTDEQYRRIVVKVPSGSEDAYKEADIWKNFVNISDNPEYAKDNIKIELEKDWYSAYPENRNYYTPQPFGYTITPEIFADEPVEFTSSDTSVLTINKDAAPVVRKAGDVKVTATIVSNGATAECDVTAYSEPKSVSFAEGSRLTLNVGDIHQFDFAVNPMMIEPHMLTWTSSDPEVLDVDEDGVATAKSVGSATVTLATYNNRKATCTVSVDQRLGVGSAVADTDAPIDVFTPAGVKVVTAGRADDLKTLAPGIYIVRQGETVYKITL